MSSVPPASPPWSTIAVANSPIEHKEVDMRTWFGAEMCLIHNVLIRGINALWTNAPLVTPADEAGYAGYALACLHTIHSHHDAEEKITIPRLQHILDMSHNLEQHEAFHGPLDELQEYFMRVRDKKERHDAVNARRLIEALGHPLVEHLNDELTTISPEKLAVVPDEVFTGIEKAVEEYIKDIIGIGALVNQFPFTLTMHDRKDAPNWPPVPAAIMWFARNIGYFLHRSQWKFAPFDRHGNPQTYEP